MSLTMVGQLPGHVAAADLSTKQYFLVKVSATDKVNLAGAGEDTVGVLINKPKSGVTADVFVFGIGEVILGGTIATGKPFKSDANGEAVLADTAHDRCGGYILEGGVDGNIVKALIIPGSLSHA